VTVLAALYFVWLAWRIANAPPIMEEAGTRQAPSFVSGFGLSLVNPKGYAAMAALFSGFVLVRDRLVVDAAAKIVLLTLVIVAVNVLWLMSGALMTRFFRDPRSNRVINVTFAVLLLLSVVLAVIAA
jgi:threonine/homoserine/homoserine lactone efflux protein